MSSVNGASVADVIGRTAARRCVRVAVIGAGPSGLYATELLAERDEFEAHVDVFDRLPAPFGLVRYGVAPDHFSLRDVRNTLEKTLFRPNVRLFANVEVGRDVTVAELRRLYDVIVFAYGAGSDRRLQIPGEDLTGTLSARTFVSWYCGHPDHISTVVEDLIETVNSVVIVGAGNVALDVARTFATPVEELAKTDMPQHVLDVLQKATVSDIHLLARRGPLQANFTTKELRELGSIEGVDVVVDPAELVLDAAGEAEAVANRLRGRNLDVLRDWANGREGVSKDASGKRISFHFYRRPVEIVGSVRVTAVRVERTTVGGDGSVTGTSDISAMPADLVIASIGYRGEPLSGAPFDGVRHVVPSDRGRVRNGERVIPTEYAVGWIKRGPTGIIGTNKKDAVETVAAIVEDVASLNHPVAMGGDAIVRLLKERSVPWITIDGWRSINAAEIALGGERGCARTTLHTRKGLLEAASMSGDEPL